MCPSLGIMSLLRQNLPSAHREIIFQILLNNTDIRLYLPFSDWFGTVNEQCPFAVLNQPENGKYNLISVRFEKISKQIICVRLCLREPHVSRHNRDPTECHPWTPWHHIFIFLIVSNKESKGSSIRVNIAYILHGTIYYIFAYYMRTVQSYFRSL